ncbi:MAG: hypothetical protein AAB817_01740 [Patescibacteria group bacterium]
MKYYPVILADLFHVTAVVTVLALGFDLIKPGLATNFLNLPLLILATVGFGLALLVAERYR